MPVRRFCVHLRANGDLECLRQKRDLGERIETDRKTSKITVDFNDADAEITALCAIGQPEQFFNFLKDYSIKQKISLKKNPETGFMEKVNFYFQNLDYPSVVIIDNFETVSEDSEVIDFLLHISGFQNVKIIIISKTRILRVST